MTIYALSNPGLLIDRNSGGIIRDWVCADLETGVVEIIVSLTDAGTETKKVFYGRGMLLFLKEDDGE